MPRQRAPLSELGGLDIYHDECCAHLQFRDEAGAKRHIYGPNRTTHEQAHKDLEQPAKAGSPQLKKSHGASDLKHAAWGEATTPEARSIQNEVPRAFWKPLGQRKPEVFKMSFPEHSGRHLAAEVCPPPNTTPQPGRTK